MSRFLSSVLRFAITLHMLGLFAFGCILSDGYLPVSNYDHVKNSDSILRAEAVSNDRGKVSFKVIEVLKGAFTSETFYDREMDGGCFPYTFQASHQLRFGEKVTIPVRVEYLLFLERNTTGWSIYERAMSQMNAPVSLPNSSLLAAVRQYVRIDALNNYDIEKKELKSLRHIAANRRDPLRYPERLATEISQHFRLPASRKSYQDLMRIYADGSKEEKRRVLWALAWGKHAEASSFFTQLLKSPISSNYLGPISEFITQTKNEELLLKLGKNFPRMETSFRWPVMWALIRTAEARHSAIMLSALRSANREEAERIAEWFEKYPSTEASGIIQKILTKEK